LRIRMMGGVGAGGEKPSATRFRHKKSPDNQQGLNSSLLVVN